MSRTTPEISSIGHAFNAIRALVAGAKVNENLTKAEALATIDDLARVGHSFALAEAKRFEQLLDYAVEYEKQLRLTGIAAPPYEWERQRAGEVAAVIAPLLLERLAPVPPAPVLEEATSNPAKFHAEAAAFAAWLTRARELVPAPDNRGLAELAAREAGVMVRHNAGPDLSKRPTSPEHRAELIERGYKYDAHGRELADPAPDGPNYEGPVVLGEPVGGRVVLRCPAYVEDWSEETPERLQHDPAADNPD